MNLYEVLNSYVEMHPEDIQSSNLFLCINKEKLDNGEDNELFDLLKNICSLRMEVKEKGAVFCPFIVFNNGKRSFSVEDLSDEDYQKLQSIDVSRLPLAVKARLSDIIWTEKHIYQYGETAANAYLELYDRLLADSKYLESLEYIRRSICISIQLNLKEEHEKACSHIYKSIIDLGGNDDGFYSLRAIEIILDQKYGDDSEMLSILDNIIRMFNGNIGKVEQAYEIKVEIYNKKKMTDEAKETNLELAEYYASFANSIMEKDIQGAMRAATFIQKAILLCRQNKAPERADELHHQLIEIQKEIPKQMTPLSIPIDFGKYKTIIDANMTDLSLQECIIRLSQFISFPSQDQLRKEVVESLHKNPFSSLFTKTIISSSGQSLLSLPPLDINNPESDPWMPQHMHQKLLEQQRILGDIWIDYMFCFIREHFAFNEDDLKFITDSNPIIPEGREKIIRTALYKVLSGQFYEAVHILAPQIENIFRVIAKEVGAITVTLDSNGVSKEKVLSSLFDLPELLECYDNDILFTFEGLLNEQAGANIRNEVAHGLLEEEGAGSGECLFFDAAVIKLLLLTSPEAYRIYKNSERLKTLEKLDILELVNKNESE